MLGEFCLKILSQNISIGHKELLLYATSYFPFLRNNNNNNNNNKPICNAPDASVTDPEARRTLRNITVRVDHYKQMQY